MNFSSLQSSVQKFGMNQALKYLEKDPETNIPKLMNLVDKVMPEGWYGSQRKVIREQIDEKGVWYDYIMKLYDLDAGVRQAVFKNFIFNATLMVVQNKRSWHKNIIVIFLGPYYWIQHLHVTYIVQVVRQPNMDIN